MEKGRFTVYFANIHPLVFLAAYVLAIPCYAYIYHHMEAEFYQATTSLDATYVRYQFEVENRIANTIQQWLNHHASDTYAVKADSVSVDNLEFNGNDARFVAWWDAVDRTGQGMPQVTAYTEWTLKLEVADLDARYYEDTMAEIANIPSHLSLLLPSKTWTVKNLRDWTATVTGRFTLPKPVYFDLLRLRRASHGQTIAVTGSYPRFIYFSAITQTTVGFGDIVPITDHARRWVTSQAILGVVVVGLFLNALAARIARVAASQN